MIEMLSCSQEGYYNTEFWRRFKWNQVWAVTHLPALVTIISVPSWLNSSQSAFISSCTLMLATLGFFFTRDLLGVDDEEEDDEEEEEEEQLVVPGSPCAASEPEYGG